MVARRLRFSILMKYKYYTNYDLIIQEYKIKKLDKSFSLCYPVNNFTEGSAEYAEQLCFHVWPPSAYSARTVLSLVGP